jgi:K+-transporting ATPase ATPase C chain
MTEPEEADGAGGDSGSPPPPVESALERADAVPPQPAPLFLREQIRPILFSVPLLTLLTGVVYPLALAGPARLLFPRQCAGSLVVRDHVVVGSRLIAQSETRPGAFHPRPSAAGAGYDATASGGTNLGPSNPKLLQDVRQLAEDYRRQNGLPAGGPVPVDAVTRSGSGLDPHISPVNAALQVPRVARERCLSEEAVRRLVAEHTAGPQLGFLGAPQVSVLELNLALDKVTATPAPHRGAGGRDGR